MEVYVAIAKIALKEDNLTRSLMSRVKYNFNCFQFRSLSYWYPPWPEKNHHAGKQDFLRIFSQGLLYTLLLNNPPPLLWITLHIPV
jgi:hypothetical protein